MNFHESQKQDAPSFTKTINVLCAWSPLNQRDANVGIFRVFLLASILLVHCCTINIGDIALLTLSAFLLELTVAKERAAPKND